MRKWIIFIFVGTALVSCLKDDPYAEDPVEHVQFSVPSSSPVIKCVLEKFAAVRGYAILYRRDVADFGESNIFTLTKDKHQIIVNNPFSFTNYEAGLYVHKGLQVKLEALRDLRDISGYIMRESIHCAAS